MVFNTLIKQILSEQKCDEHDLAHALGCTPVQIRNLRDGKTQLPNSHTCKKIFRYCDRYDIDYSYIDWNDIAYTLFMDWGWISEYSWLDDMDKNNYILLKHFQCGKKSKVPFSTFNTVRTIPCIHCWVNQYVPLDSYTVDLSEDSHIHRFTHRCGYSYEVSYEQIKQKKFKCPHCGAIFNAKQKAENKKTDYNFINRPKLPQYWMDYDYIERYISHMAINRETVWYKTKILDFIGSIILQKAILDIEITNESISQIDVFYSKFMLNDYLAYCQRFENEVIEVDFDKHPEEKNFLLITAKLTNGEYYNLGYMSNDLFIHDRIGYVVYCTVGDDDKLIREIIDNVNFYEKLPPLEIENLEILIRENKAKQALFMLYKSLFDGIDIDDTLNQIDQRIKDLQLHLTIMETLKSCHDLVEATNFSSNDASDSFEENDLLDYDDTYEFSSYDFDDFYDE